jgi:class 3 adenylate cyclase
MWKRVVTGLVVGCVVGVAAAMVTLIRPGWIEELELYTYDVRARATAEPERADPRIVLVDVDDYDIRWVQRAVDLSWPWPREIFRVAAKHLLGSGASAVVFDFLFLDRGNSGAEDVQKFGELLGSSDRTVIGLRLSRYGKERRKPGGYGVEVGSFSCSRARKLALDLLWWQTRVFLDEAEAGEEGEEEGAGGKESEEGGAGGKESEEGGAGSRKRGRGCVVWIGGEESKKAVAKDLSRLRNSEKLAKVLGGELEPRKLPKRVLRHELTVGDIARRKAALGLTVPDGLELPTYPHLFPPLLPLVTNARLGVVVQKPDRDGLYRRYAPVMRHRREVYPSLAVASAMAAAHPDAEAKLELGDRKLVFEDTEVPLDEEGRAVIRFHGSGRSYSRVGIRHVLDVVGQKMDRRQYQQDKRYMLEQLSKKISKPKPGEAAAALDELVDLPHPARCKEKLEKKAAALKAKLRSGSGAGVKAGSPKGAAAKRDDAAARGEDAAARGEDAAVRGEDAAAKRDAAPSDALPLVAAIRRYLDSPACRVEIRDTFGKHLLRSDRRFASRFEGRDGLKPGSPKGRIFIIHAAAAALRDIKPTPLDARARGAETNAAFVDNLLNGDFIRRLESWNGAVLAFLLCVAVGLGTFLLVAVVRSPVFVALSSLLVAGLVVALYAGAAHLLFDESGLWVDVAAPSLGVALTWAAGVGVHIYQESQSRRFVQDALGRYTSPALVKELMKNPKALSLEWGETRGLTVFFSDVVSFTSISERLGAQKLVTLLNEYLTEMTDIILDQQGIVDKYIGDAIMAFWGAPMPDEQHAVHACRAALAASKKLGELQEDWERRFGERVDFRAGINSGEAVVGNMGSAHKYNYTVMGDTVNLAARLEGANKVYGTRLLIAQGTKDLVGDGFVTRQLDFVAVKGKDEPVRVYELVGERGAVGEDALDLSDRFDTALRKYREREFSVARQLFQAILSDYPGDEPCRLYVERCERYEKDPPPQDWDGVFRMTTK